MTDEKNNPLPSSEETLGLIAELGIPDPVQRGLLKAGNRLLGSALDVPTAWLEGISDNLRATSEARRLLRIKAAEELAKGFGGDSVLANRVYAQHASKILGEHVNLEDIVGVAVCDLKQKGGESAPETEPEDDWLNTFKTEASQKSSPEMKLAFGRVLSGEIQMPGSYSVRAVRTLGMLDTETATLFRNLCSMTMYIRICNDARVVSLGGNAGSNALSGYGLSFSQLNRLAEHGLIISDFNSSLEFKQLTKELYIGSYAGKNIRLTELEGIEDKIKIHGVALSGVGRELYRVVDLEENVDYTKNLAEYLGTQKIKLSLSIAQADELRR